MSAADDGFVGAGRHSPSEPTNRHREGTAGVHYRRSCTGTTMHGGATVAQPAGTRCECATGNARLTDVQQCDTLHAASLGRHAAHSCTRRIQRGAALL